MNRPYVVCHMLTSLDGKIDGAYMSVPECAPAMAAYAESYVISADPKGSLAFSCNSIEKRDAPKLTLWRR